MKPIPAQSFPPPQALDDRVEVSETAPSMDRPSMYRHSSSVTKLIETYTSVSSPTQDFRYSSARAPQAYDDVFSTPLSARSSRSRSMTSPPKDAASPTTSAARSLVRKSCIPVKTGQNKFLSSGIGMKPMANNDTSSSMIVHVSASPASLAALEPVQTSFPPPSYPFLQHSPNSDPHNVEPPSSLAGMNASPGRSSFARPLLMPSRPTATAANSSEPSVRPSPTTPKRAAAANDSPGPLSAHRSRSLHFHLPCSGSTSPEQHGSSSDVIPSSPTSSRKLIRKHSQGRMHRDIQTKPAPRHSYSVSMSIPRPARDSSFGRGTPNARAQQAERSLAFASPEQLLPANVSADHAGLRKKPSFYKRKRSQTAATIPSSTVTEASGFPAYSPISEIAKNMPSAKAGNHISCTGTRKLSDTVSGYGGSTTHSDYFGSAVASISESNHSCKVVSPLDHHEGKRLGGWLSYLTLHRHKSQRNATDTETDATSVSPVNEDRECVGMEKWSFPSRSHSSTSSVSSGAGRKSRTSSFSSERAGTSATSYETIPPVPALPPLPFKQFVQDSASPHAAERHSPPLSMSSRASPRQKHDDRPTTAPCSPSPSRQAHASGHLRSPTCISRTDRQLTAGDVLRIPAFLCTANQEAAKEERFLELLSRSNNSDKGTIKISLASRKARVAGVA